MEKGFLLPLHPLLFQKPSIERDKVKTMLHLFKWGFSFFVVDNMFLFGYN